MTNKSAVLYGVRDIRIEDRLAPDQVAVRVEAVGVCGPDVHYYEHGRVGALEVRAPMVIGHEAAGVVVDVGAHVEEAALGPAAHAIAMDVSDEASVTAAYAEVLRQGFCPNVVVANAGVQLFGQDDPIADDTLGAWDRTVAVNLTGTFLTVKHVVRAMLRGGGNSIVCAGSPTAGHPCDTVVPGYTETPLVTTISSTAQIVESLAIQRLVA